MSEPELDWLPSLAPPPGGLAALRERLVRRRRRWSVVVAIPLAATALLLVLGRVPGPARPGLAADDPVLLAAPPDAPVTVPADAAHAVAVRRVPVDGVVWYRVEAIER